MLGGSPGAGRLGNYAVPAARRDGATRIASPPRAAVAATAARNVLSLNIHLERTGPAAAGNRAAGNA